MIWLIALVFVALLILGCVKLHDWEFGAPLLIVLGATLIMLTVLIIGIDTFRNHSEYHQLKAFYDVNTQNYKYAIDETTVYLSKEAIKQTFIDGSVEKLGLAKSISSRIMEYRDSVNKYNLSVASMKYYDSNIWTGVMYPNEVQSMKFMVIK